jgi:hypothetical protein
VAPAPPPFRPAEDASLLDVSVEDGDDAVSTVITCAHSNMQHNAEKLLVPATTFNFSREKNHRHATLMTHHSIDHPPL